jgi:predicted RNA-binding Zn-ribbon protein involved in translation (DUF1610 family)
VGELIVSELLSDGLNDWVGKSYRTGFIGQLEALQKIFPFPRSATSYGMAWKRQTSASLVKKCCPSCGDRDIIRIEREEIARLDDRL